MALLWLHLVTAALDSEALGMGHCPPHLRNTVLRRSSLWASCLRNGDTRPGPCRRCDQLGDPAASQHPEPTPSRGSWWMWTEPRKPPCRADTCTRSGRAGSLHTSQKDVCPGGVGHTVPDPGAPARRLE